MTLFPVSNNAIKLYRVFDLEFVTNDEIERALDYQDDIVSLQDALGRISFVLPQLPTLFRPSRFSGEIEISVRESPQAAMKLAVRRKPYGLVLGFVDDVMTWKLSGCLEPFLDFAKKHLTHSDYQISDLRHSFDSRRNSGGFLCLTFSCDEAHVKSNGAAASSSGVSWFKNHRC